MYFNNQISALVKLLRALIEIKMTEHINSKTLLAKKAELQAQVVAAHFFLAGEDTEPKIAAQVLTLREQQSQMELQVATLNMELARVNGAIPALVDGKQKLLLQAITAQRWYAFKNIPEVLYDSHTGFLWPSFYYGFEMPLYSDWDQNFSLGGIGAGYWIIPTAEKGGAVIDEIYLNYPRKEKIYNKALGVGRFQAYRYGYKLEGNWRRTDSDVITYALPYCTLYDDPRIAPSCDSFSPAEKAQMVLDIFLKEGWQPVFDQPEYAEVYQTIQHHPALLNELSELEGAIAEALEYEATLHQPLTGQFDFKVDLQAYPLAAIAESSLQYAQGLLRWSDQLLNKIDEFARKNHELIQAATALHQRLHHTLKISRFEAVGDSLKLLTTRDDYLKNALRFNLDRVRSKLINAGQQAKNLQNQLDNSALNGSLLTDLAAIQHAPRPDFAFIAEYTAQIVLTEVQQLEWLQVHQAGLERLAESHLAGLTAFNVFTSKDKDDFLRAAEHEEIEAEVAQGWFDEWAQQRLIIEWQILPLYELAFSQACPLDTVNDVLEVLDTYRLTVDKFYKEESHVIHQKYAFDANSSLQGDYETRLALFKLCGEFQSQLEGLLFALPEVAVRIALLRWSEAITQQHFVGVSVSTDSLLALHQDSVIWQTISQELRALQQRSLETFIQDVKHFAQARIQRDNEFNSLVFKMRKALQKA